MEAPHDPAERLHRELRRKFVAWRSAVLGVGSQGATAAEPASPPADTAVQPPQQQAAIELHSANKPQWGILIVGIVLAMNLAPVAVIWPPGGAVLLTGLLTGAALLARNRKRKQLREAAGRVLNSAFNLIGLGRLNDASEVLQPRSLPQEPWALASPTSSAPRSPCRNGAAPPAKHLPPAISRPMDIRARTPTSSKAPRALRAFARASLGNHEGARDDIDAVVATATSRTPSPASRS
ncbi:MAG: hypothetical protein R3F14_40370 [Polyangiaceae bacterium]